MFKFVGFVTVFVCLLQRSSSFSIVRPDVDTANQIGTVAKSFDSSKWTKVSAPQEPTVETNSLAEILVAIFEPIVIAIILRAELFAMADGTHLFFPEMETDIAENEHRKIAIATVEMWMKLHTMERVEDIISNATVRTGQMSLKNQTKDLTSKPDKEEQQRKVMQLLFNQIDLEFKANDPAMYAEYVAGKSKAGSKSLPPIGKRIYQPGGNESSMDVKKVDQFLSTYPAKCSKFVNMVFLSYAAGNLSKFTSKTTFNNSLLAKSMVELAARPDKKDTVEAIYQEVLDTTSKLTNCKDNNCTRNENILRYSQALQSVLPEVLAKHPDVSAELELMKEKTFAANADLYRAVSGERDEFHLSCNQSVPYTDRPHIRYSY